MRTALISFVLVTLSSVACSSTPTTFGSDDPSGQPRADGGQDAAKANPTGDAGPGGSDSSMPIPGQPSLQMVSGTGAIVSSGWPATDPCRVRLLDKDNKPMVGETVTWTSSPSVHIQAFGNTSTSDTDGIALTTFNAFGIDANLPYEEDTVTATWNGLTATFAVTITQDPAGQTPTSPLITFSVPSGNHDMGSVKAGTTVTGGIQGLAVMQQGPGTGQGIPHWGFRLTDNSDRLVASPVSCVGGTVISDAKGNVSCDVLVPTTPGEYSFTLFAGGNLYWTDGHVTVTP